MHPTLNRNLFFVKEHVGWFKSANQFDIFDPTTGEMILHCREPKLGWLTKILRFSEYKRFTPFEVVITTPTGEPVLTVRRGVSFFVSTVEVSDARGVVLGVFKQKWFSIGGAFSIRDTAGQEMCKLQGKWHSWNFSFMAGETQLAHVAKKWNGLGKEMFTTADNYMLEISQDVPMDHPLRLLIVAAVMCIDMVLKE